MKPGKDVPVRRGRGERAGLSIAAIVAAARSLPTDGVTMQAVADRLGVDRKALSHHVVDRNGLLERVAADAVSGHLAAIRIGADEPWPAVCRTYARGLADAVIGIGALSRHFRWDEPHPALLALAETALDRLIAAGFDDETAGRALSMLSMLSIGYAQNRLAAARARDTPMSDRLRRSFAGAEDEFRNIARITESTVRTYDAEQLDLMIDIFRAGLGRLDGARARDKGAGDAADGRSDALSGSEA